ncbi:uncharacterized protein TNCV_395751 [Trichonephila clavipes]|nr:uncharacterized protein TNCV_395751 [Trichonephila clavipes]
MKTRRKWYTHDFLAESRKLLEKVSTSKDTGHTRPKEGMSNISKYPRHLPDLACFRRQSSQPGPRRIRGGLGKQDSSYGFRGGSLGRRGQASVPANLLDHPAQSIALDKLYPIRFAHMR